MHLSIEEQEILTGRDGPASQKAMEILVALGTIYGADQLVPVNSVQIAGVSYDNLGEAGLAWLKEMQAGGAKARVLTTLNPAGMDIENWQVLGIDPDFTEKQQKVLEVFTGMGFIPSCTCTPYLIGNLPHYGEHISWAESSAVCYANSVLGARTNREGGPSAIAAAITGRTPEYGFHLTNARMPSLGFDIQASVRGTYDFGALGLVIGSRIEAQGKAAVPYIRGIPTASLEELKSFCASVATYGGVALFHMEGITPEANQYEPLPSPIRVTQEDLDIASQSLTDDTDQNIDFVSLGCPHLSIREIAILAELLEGKRVTREFWITTSRITRQLADQMGFTQVIEASGAKFAVDTCCVVAPIKNRFTTMVTDSAKACYYARGKNGFKTIFKPFAEVVKEAIK